jgi:hypothetical protein
VLDADLSVGVVMKSIAGAALVLTGVALSTAAFGSSVASATDPLVGKTYSAAAAAIGGWGSGGKPIIATVSGSQLATDDCIVVSWRKSMFINSSGTGRPGDFLLNLDCNQPLAEPGHPGNSVTSVEGKAAKEDDANATYVAKNPKVCEKNANTAAWCTELCKKTELCDFAA